MVTITQSQVLVSHRRPLEDLILREPTKTPESNSSLVIQETEIPGAGHVLPDNSTQPAPSSTQSALIINSERKYEIVRDFPRPRIIAPTEVVIRNHAAGLNHIDWKSVDYNFCLPELPWITGREMAGVVEDVGSDVTRFKKGDRVWTSEFLPPFCRHGSGLTEPTGTYYRDRRAGCFQDLVAVPQHTVMPLPLCLDFTDAACLGVAALTAAMSMWRWLGVPLYPTQASATAQRETMLIWGGSTVTGQFAIQVAASAGLETIAVCSESTAPLVAALGATHVVTYTGKTDLHVIGEILCLARGSLTRAIDLVGAKTANLVLQVIAACGPQMTVDFVPLAFMSSKAAIPSNARVHNVEMKQFVLNPALRIYGERLNELVECGTIRLPAIRVLEGGLSAVEEGLRIVKKGSIGGQKLVVKMER